MGNRRRIRLALEILLAFSRGSVAMASTGILWSAGWRGEGPLAGHGPVPRDAFAVARADGQVVTARSRAAVPQRLAPGQTLVIHPGPLPVTGLALGVSLVPLGSAAADDPDASTPPARALRMRFNDHPLWWRTLPDGHAVLDAYVPPEAIAARGENLWVIENEGRQELAFLALRLEHATPRSRIMACLTGAHMLPGLEAGAVAQAVIRISGVDDASDRALAAARRRGQQVVADLRGAIPPEDAGMVAARYGGDVLAWVVGTDAVADAIHAARADAWICRTGAFPEISETFRSVHGGYLLDALSGDAHGGMDRFVGRFRTARRRAGLASPPTGIWLRLPPSLQDAAGLGRRGEQTVRAMVNAWMNGADGVVLEGGERGSDFFPDPSGIPSPAWTAVRLAFGLGEGAPRRIPCTVVPADGKSPWRATDWIAVQHDAGGVTLLVMTDAGDADRTARIILPVPWQGETHGMLDGVRLGNWREQRPEGLPTRPVRTTASPAAVASAAGKDGFVSLEIALSGLHRIRLWPAGRPPRDRSRQLALLRMEPEPATRPREGFRMHDDPLPPALRYGILRAPDWPVTAAAGRHTAEVRPATTATLPAWGSGEGRARPVSARNVTPWDAQSLFMTFRPEAGGPHALRLFTAVAQARASGARAVMLHLRARASTPAGHRAGRSPSTVPLWVGVPGFRQRLALPVDRWQTLTATLAPGSPFAEDPGSLMFWPDPGEQRHLEVEVNGCVALYPTAEDGRPLASARVAVHEDSDGNRLRILVEGPPGAPVEYRLRLAHPARPGLPEALIPEGFAGVSVRFRPEAQILEFAVSALPPETHSPPVEQLRAVFPDARGDGSLLRFDLPLAR